MPNKVLLIIFTWAVLIGYAQKNAYSNDADPIIKPASITSWKETPLPKNWLLAINKKLVPLIQFDFKTTKSNPSASVLIILLEDGTIQSTSLEKPSESAEWNKQVLEVLNQLKAFPVDMNGKRPLSFLSLSITPKDGIIQKIEQQDIGKLGVTFQPDADAYYPSFSKRSGEQGTAAVRLIIDETGSVEDVALLQSSSFPRLDRAAIALGKAYRFTPYVINGSPQRISTNLLIKFNLKEADQKGIKPKFEKNPLTMGG
jgi:TonB family protein